MSDTKTPSTADYVETGIVCAVFGFLVLILIEHLMFGEAWGFAAIRSALIAVFMTTVVIGYHARKTKSRSK
jgi:inner membrane protein involved in colicin E2 resistance